jgi:glucosamine-phosphate N-acetyltransferase
MRNFEIVNLKDDIRENKVNSEYYNRIFQLLSNLTDAPEIPYMNFINIIENLPFNHNIYVYKYSNQLVGMITLIVEEKLIHGGKRIGHIEDLVVDPKHRSSGIATQLILFATDICRQCECYKIILDCDESIVKFYNKNGFIQAGLSMRYNI